VSTERLRSQARRNLESNEAAIRRWWVNKYNLPANHELYRTRSWVDWQIEMFEDLYVRRAELKEQMADGTVDNKKALKVLSAINSVLGDNEEVFDDPLIDQWERDLAEGRIPDLEN